MSSECTPDTDDTVLTIPNRDLPGTLRLWNRYSEGGVVQFCVAVNAPDLQAEVHDVAAELGAADAGSNEVKSLVTFLELLAEDFTGWQGVRSWYTLDRDLMLDAQYGTGGHIDLTWTVSPSRHSGTGIWRASVHTTVEAGAELQELANTVHRFMYPHDP